MRPNCEKFGSFGSGRENIGFGILGARELPRRECAALTICCDLNEDGGKPAHFVCCDAGILPLAARSFDVVILNHSLEYFRIRQKCRTRLGACSAALDIYG